MAQDILSNLMGYGLEEEVDSPEQQQARIKALRNQIDFGNLLSVSPSKGVSGMGQRMTEGAYGQAGAVGKQRKSALARSRQKLIDDETREQRQVTNLRAEDEYDYREEQDLLQEEARQRGETRDIAKIEYDQSGFDTPSLEWRKDGDEYYQWGKDLKDNVMKEVPDSRSKNPPWKTPNTTQYKGAVKFHEIEGLPMKMGMNFGVGGRLENIIYGAEEYTSMDELRKAKPDWKEEVFSNIFDAAYQKSSGTETAKSDVKGFTEYRDNIYAEIDNLQNLEPAWKKIYEGAKAGGELGPVWFQNNIPNWKNETAQVQQGVNALTLATLGSEDSLVPVSDRDAATLQGKSVPNYWGKELESYAKHEMELNKRLIAAQRFKAEWVRKNKDVPRGEAAAQLRQKMQDIVYAPDETGLKFDITHRLDPGKREVGELNGRMATVADLEATKRGTPDMKDMTLGEVWAEVQRVEENRKLRESGIN